ncbi:hypothetical protein [Streptomyces brevispora]|uniref:hypothetical protein n=1 Tax=Streptomyces brevispora TaxID=887462 RepID=UPI002E36E88F|nr:hypothetical protein [Streptomyces brevispora]
MTVHRFTKDVARPMESACIGACLPKWPVGAPLDRNDNKAPPRALSFSAGQAVSSGAPSAAGSSVPAPTASNPVTPTAGLPGAHGMRCPPTRSSPLCQSGFLVNLLAPIRRRM